jgi:predicted short-subunit dehydrogenase-like oxidoreductase (DUF2520 family)
LSGFPNHITIVGAGRLGQGLGLALQRAGVPVLILARRPGPWLPDLPVRVSETLDVGDADLILLTVPDGAIPAVAERLAGTGRIGAAHVVLHTSGLMDRRALVALEATGAALGSLHPLQTIADPASAPAAFHGAYAAVEGDVRAVETASLVARAVGLTPFPISGGSKALYHATAALLANSTVALAGLAERLARDAGLPEELRARIYLPLLRGTVENLERLGPARALTGPVRRGDVVTIERHLAALPAGDRALYRALGRLILALAREAGLEAEAADRVEALLVKQ